MITDHIEAICKYFNCTEEIVYCALLDFFLDWERHPIRSWYRQRFKFKNMWGPALEFYVDRVRGELEVKNMWGPALEFYVDRVRGELEVK